MAKKPNSAKTLDAKFVGVEPIIAAIESRSDSEYTRALNWYNYSYDSKQSIKWLLQWMKINKFSSDIIDVVRKAPDWAPGTTSGWIARMSMNGTELPQGCYDYVKERIEEVVSRYNKRVVSNDQEEADAVSNVVSIRDRTVAKMKQTLAVAEDEVVDGFMRGDGITMYQFLQKHMCSPVTANYIRAYYIKSRDELFDSDPQVKEAYGKELKKYQTFWQSVIDDIDRFVGNKKATKVRSPRTPKAKPLSKLVERLKYMKEFAPLKIVSVIPQEIIGAQQLWTYNTKTKVLTSYYAKGNTGFAVKGTSITEFDTEASIGKRLRKPEVVIKDLLTAGKVAIKKIMPELKTTDITPNGRINQDTILLRVVK